MFGDFNGQIKLRAKQKFKFLSASNILLFFFEGVAFTYINPISFSHFQTVMLLTQISFSTNLFFICFVVRFLF